MPVRRDLRRQLGRAERGVPGPSRDELGACGRVGGARQAAARSRSRPRCRIAMRPGVHAAGPGSDGRGHRPPAAKSVEVWGSIVDRHSIKDARIGIDVSRSFGVGDLAYQRSDALFVRGVAQRELASGKGEWEAEVSYSQIIDSVIGMGPRLHVGRRLLRLVEQHARLGGRSALLPPQARLVRDRDAPCHARHEHPQRRRGRSRGPPRPAFCASRSASRTLSR